MKSIIKLFIYSIIGYIIFTVIFLTTQIATLEILGFNGNIVEIYMHSFKINIIFYIMLYFILLIVNLLYNMIVTKKLNEKLNKIKERSGEHEE